MPLDFSQEGVKELSNRFIGCYLALAILFLFVFMRLGFLQIVRGDFFWILSSEHTIKEIRVPATRGILFDRHKTALAENRPAFNLAVIPQYLRDRAAVKASLESIAGLQPDFFEMRWKAVRKLPPFFPLTILSDVSYDVAAKLRVLSVTSLGGEDAYDLRGVEVVPRPSRGYPAGSLAAATLGYLGEISERELTRLQTEEPGRYFLGDHVGATGIEKYWETLLKGRDGFKRKIVDAVGREVSSEEVLGLLQNELPTHGSNLVLSVDRTLQKFAEAQFKDKGGALVALNPQNGEILALVSLPSYDLTELSGNVTSAEWQTLITDPRKLFLNRALQGYPPGSTYKVVTAIAALEEGELKPDEKIYCPGGLQFGKRFFRCWRKGGHGMTSLHRALSESCDTFFYTMGLRLGVDRLAAYAEMFGLGRATGIDLPDEKGGLIPTSAWKRRVFHEEWYPGENLSIAVGQGSVLVTPLQNALMLAQLVNGGQVIRPHLLKTILRQTDQGLQQEEFRTPPEVLDQKIEISETTRQLIRAALVDVVADPAGTAHGSRSSSITLGGKTGTAQVISEEGRIRAGGGAHLRDHAWFIAFAPADKPELVVSVLVEHGGFGASAAAPIAKAVIEKYRELSEQAGGL